MSGRTHMQTTLARISQPPRKTGHLFALAASTLEPCNSPSIPSPRCKFFAWQGTEDDADHCRAWFTHSLLLQPDIWQATENGSIAARSQRRPCGNGLQQSVSIERHLSRIHPCLTRPLARCLSRALRHGTALLRTTCALWISAFRKSFRQISAKNADEKIFRTFRKSAVWPWERGTLASLRAGVSRVRTGQIQNRRKHHGTLYQHRHREGLPGQRR